MAAQAMTAMATHKWHGDRIQQTIVHGCACLPSNCADCSAQVAYDVMDVDAPQFQADFTTFKKAIKELEHRLGALIVQVILHCRYFVKRRDCIQSYRVACAQAVINIKVSARRTSMTGTEGPPDCQFAVSLTCRLSMTAPRWQPHSSCWRALRACWSVTPLLQSLPRST